jgi:hypothetical protein
MLLAYAGKVDRIAVALRVEVEDQRRLAAFRLGLREKHGSASEGQLDLMGAIGMLHQQKAEIGGRRVRDGDG